MKPIRVLVVEDSRSIRERLVELLSSDPQFEVVGAAEDGKMAIELCRTLRPDVMTVDMVLPVMSGLAVTEYVMAHFPTPILIVSSSFNRGDLYQTYDALAAGAVDVLDKGGANGTDEDWDKRFLNAVRLVSRIKVITHPRGRLRSYGQASSSPPREAKVSQRGRRGQMRDKLRAVAIGASTGGPGALSKILTSLPVGFPLPILIVIHIGEPFGKTFTDWLGSQSPHRVRFARDGEPLEMRPSVLVAPPDHHLLIEDGMLRLSQGPERHSCRPSVDILFETVAKEFGSQAIGCLLTGMGRDGAVGLLRMREAGGITIAQDEPSSAVYGMPREAALIGAAQHILPLDEIGAALASFAGAADAEGRR